MNRVTWLADGFVDPATATFAIDDPGARFGDGLRETLRVENGTAPWIDRHLIRLTASADALGFTGRIPAVTEIDRAIRAVAARCDAGIWRATVIVTPFPTLMVDAVPVTPDPDTPVTAVSCPGLWVPGNGLAEHKTVAYLPNRIALHAAAERNADTALLVDHDDNLGEGATANVFCVVDGTILTPPVRGILPGTTRAAVLRLTAAEERDLPPPLWRHCDEIFLTSAVHHVVGVASVDGTRVGDGTVGPLTRSVQRAIDEAFHG